MPVPVSVTSSKTKRLADPPGPDCGDDSLDIFRLDAQRSSVGHGIASVDHQIQYDLFDLSGVGFHSIQLRIEDKREFNIFFDQAAQHLVQIANRLIDIENYRFDHLLTAEHQELPGK